MHVIIATNDEFEIITTDGTTLGTIEIKGVLYKNEKVKVVYLQSFMIQYAQELVQETLVAVAAVFVVAVVVHL